MAVINREHKDRLFNFLFGNGDHKEWILSLYNAVNGSSYENPDDIQMMTIEDIIYMGMKNDSAFMISDMLNIYEQQSTYNPNMPVRFLMYAGRLYDKYIHMNHKNIYSSSLVRLPVPKLIVFYNGFDKKEDTILKLSDAFISKNDDKEAAQHMEYDIDVKVRMININHGYSKPLMDKCSPLAEYAWLIDRIRKNSIDMGIEDAVDRAIDDMPDSFLIRIYLLANRSEVKNMCITEYNEAETMQMLRQEAKEMAEKEANEKVKKMAEEMAKEIAEEKAEKMAAEKAEKIAEEKAEKMAAEKAEKMAAEKAEKIAEEKAEKAEDKFGELIACLLADGMMEDVKRAISDKTARIEMYRKYEIV